MRGTEQGRAWRSRVAGLLVGSVLVPILLWPEISQGFADAHDDRRFTSLGSSCGILPDASVARWVPGTRAQREETTPERLRCRWRAADPTRLNPTVRLTINLAYPGEGATADQHAQRQLYSPADEGPALALAGLKRQEEKATRWVRTTDIGDEAVTTMTRLPQNGEVRVTVYARRANAILRLSHRAYGVPEETAVEAAQTLARESLGRL